MSKEILTYEEFLYIENDDEIEVVGYTGSEDPVEIPEYINDKPVTSLGYCDIPIYSTGVKINSNIRSIAIEAMNFKECSPWSEVIFDKHSWINEIIAEKTQPYFSVSSDVLYSKDKTRLIRCFNWGKKKITIPKKVEIIEKDAFWLCDEIEKVTIPENVKYIGDSAFYSDTEITVTGKDTELGVDVAGKIVLAGNEKYIEKNGLLLSADKKRLLKKVGNSTSFIAPKELEIIDNNATGSGKIKKVQLNSGLRYIGHNAFKNAEVPSIIIPNTVEHMEVDAFKNYDRLVTLELEEGNSRYRSDGKAIYEINEDGTEKVFRVSNRTIKEFELPETVKELGPDVFNRFEKLKKLSLNEGLEIFNEKCLDMRGYNCAEMSRIKIPSTVKKIILSDEYGVLNGQLKYSINEDNPNYFFDDDICYEVNNEGEFTALFCQNNIIRRAVINEGTVKISRHAFSFADNRDKESRCNLLNKLELPDSLRTIEDEAFSYCTELIKINLGASVSKISPTAFKGCTKLEKITVSPENSFYRDIDGVLFDKEGKKLIIYPEGRTAKTYEMPDSVEDIGTAFSNVSCIGSLYLSKNIGKLKNDAFGYECGINALHFKSDIKNIDPCAFGKRAYNPRVRENQIEIFAESDYYFNKYLEEKMQGAKGDIIIAEQNDNPEVRKLKKLFSFKKVLTRQKKHSESCDSRYARQRAHC